MSSKEYDVMAEKLPVEGVRLPTYNCATPLPHSIQSILSPKPMIHTKLLLWMMVLLTIQRSFKSIYAKEMFTFHQSKIKGCLLPRAIGIKSAPGASRAVLFTDDIWLPEKLQTDIKYFETHSEISMVYI